MRKERRGMKNKIQVGGTKFEYRRQRRQRKVGCEKETATMCNGWMVTVAKTTTRTMQRLKPEALLIKPSQGKSYAEVLREIHTKAKPEDSVTA